MNFRFALAILLLACQTLTAQDKACTLPASDGWTVSVEGDNNGAIIQSEELTIETIEECVNCEFYVDNTIYIVNGVLQNREKGKRTSLRPVAKLAQPKLAEQIVSSLDQKDQGECLKDLLRDQIQINKYTVYEIAPDPEFPDQKPTTILAVSVSPSTLMDYGLKVEFPINGGIQRIWELGRHYFRKDGKCLGRNQYNENLCKEYDFATDFIGEYAVIGVKTPGLVYSIIDRNGNIVIGELKSHKIINYTNGRPAGFMVSKAGGEKAYYRANGDSTKFYDSITFGSPFLSVGNSNGSLTKYDDGYGLVSASSLKEILPPIHEINSFTFAGDEYIGADVNRRLLSRDAIGFVVYKYNQTKQTVRKVFKADYSKGKIFLNEGENSISIIIDPSSGPNKVALIDLRSEKLYGPVIGESFIGKTQNVIRVKESYSKHRLYSALTLEHLVTIDDEIYPKPSVPNTRQAYNFFKKSRKGHVIVDVVAGKVLHDNVLTFKKHNGEFFLAKGVAKKDQISVLTLGPDGNTVLIANQKLGKGSVDEPRWQRLNWSIYAYPLLPELSVVDLRVGKDYKSHTSKNHLYVLKGNKKVWSVIDDTTKGPALVTKLSDDIVLLQHAAQYKKGKTYGAKHYDIELFAGSKHLKTLPYQQATIPGGIYPTSMVTNVSSGQQNILLPDGTLHFKEDQVRIRHAYRQDTCVTPNNNLVLVLGKNKKERFYDMSKKAYSTAAYNFIAPFKCSNLTYGSLGSEEIQFIEAMGKERSPKLFFDVNDMRDFGAKTYAVVKKKNRYSDGFGLYEVSRNATILPPTTKISEIIFTEEGLIIQGRRNVKPYEKWTANLLVREDLPVPECISGDCDIYRDLLTAGRN